MKVAQRICVVLLIALIFGGVALALALDSNKIETVLKREFKGNLWLARAQIIDRYNDEIDSWTTVTTVQKYNTTKRIIDRFTSQGLDLRVLVDDHAVYFTADEWAALVGVYKEIRQDVLDGLDSEASAFSIDMEEIFDEE